MTDPITPPGPSPEQAPAPAPAPARYAAQLARLHAQVNAALAGGQATVIGVQVGRFILQVCGQAEAAAPDSLFWTLGGRHPDYPQSPFDGTLQSLTRQMVARVDLDKWPRLPRATAAEPAATTGQSQSGPVR